MCTASLPGVRLTTPTAEEVIAVASLAGSRDPDGPGSPDARRRDRGAGNFSPQVMYDAARLYYERDATQAQIAESLAVSRATVSRILSEARREGIVRIEVVSPTRDDETLLAKELTTLLHLRGVHVVATSSRAPVGATLAPALSEVLRGVGLQPGDVLMVASGRTVYETAQAELPLLRDVLVVPTVGGHDEPEAWYQANEIARQVAAKVGGRPVFLFTPALPSADLHERLVRDPATRRVFALWRRARCAVLGVGAPTLRRPSLPRFVPTDTPALRDSVGDVCYRFYDGGGRALAWPGSERLIATSIRTLRRVPVSIAVAAGSEKVPGILAGARAGYFNHLVTDAATAVAILAST